MTIAAIGLRKLYIQVMHNKAEIVQIISFVFFCTIKGNLQPRRSGHDGRTCPAMGQIPPPPPIGASSAGRTNLAYKLLTDVFFDRFVY